jgi:hypothetical protein
MRGRQRRLSSLPVPSVYLLTSCLFLVSRQWCNVQEGGAGGAIGVQAQLAGDVVAQCMQNQLTAKELIGAVTSEGSDQFLGTNENNERNTFDEEEASMLWTLATGYEWERLANITHDADLDGISDEAENSSTNTTSSTATEDRLLTPFLLCSRKYNVSGYDRFLELRDMVLSVDPTVEAYLNDTRKTEVLSNDDDLSCAITRIPAYVAAQCCFSDVAQRSNEMDATKLDVVIQPYVSLMKLSQGSMARLEHAFHSQNQTQAWNKKGSNSAKLIPNIQITFCQGAIDFTKDADGNDIVDDEIAVTKGKELQQALLTRDDGGSNEAARNVQGAFFHMVDGTNLAYDNYVPDAAKQKKYRQKLLKKKEHWDKVFQHETEDSAAEQCRRIIKAAEVTADAASSTLLISTPRTYKIYNNDTGVLEEEGSFDDGDWSVQKFCVMAIVSTITGYDSVCGIDVQQEMAIDNSVSAYLQQTGIQGQTPFYDMNLNGNGQIVSISDTGIATDNCYFKNDNGKNILKTGVSATEKILFSR